MARDKALRGCQVPLSRVPPPVAFLPCGGTSFTVGPAACGVRLPGRAPPHQNGTLCVLMARGKKSAPNHTIKRGENLLGRNRGRGSVRWSRPPVCGIIED